MGVDLADGLQDIAKAMGGVSRMMQIHDATKDLKGGPYFDPESAQIAIEREKLDRRMPLEELFKGAQIRNIESSISAREAGTELQAKKFQADNAPPPPVFTPEGQVNPEALKKMMTPSLRTKLMEAEAITPPPPMVPGYNIKALTPKDIYGGMVQEERKAKRLAPAQKKAAATYKKLVENQLGPNALSPEDLKKALETVDSMMQPLDDFVGTTQEAEDPSAAPTPGASTDTTPLPGESFRDYKLRLGIE